MTVLATPGGLVRTNSPAPLSRYPTSTQTVSSRTGAGAIALLSQLDYSLSYEAMYQRQLWVAVCVNKLYRGVARLPLKVFEYSDADQNDRVRVKDHPLAQLLQNPYPNGSSWDYKAAIMWDRKVYGNSLWVKVRSGPGQPPKQLWRLPWRNVEVRTNESGVPLLYIFQGRERAYSLDPIDVVHHRDTPGLIGISPLEPLRNTLALEDGAQRWSLGHFERGAAPAGVFSTPKKIDKASMPLLRAELENLYGGVDNAGRFAILGDDMKFQNAVMTAVDTAYIDVRRLAREETAAAYEISPPMIGILDRATFNNVEELRRSYYVDTLGPALTEIEEVHRVQLIEPEPMWRDIFVEFDLDEILKGDMEKRARAWMMEQQSSTGTINERRRRENLPPIDNPIADTVLVPANMIPIDADLEQIQARSSAPAPIGQQSLMFPEQKDSGDPEANMAS